MALQTDQLRKKIEIYFRNATREQLRKDLIDAGLEVYCKVTDKIIGASFLEKPQPSVLEDSINDNIFLGRIEKPDIVRPTYLYCQVDVRSANDEANVAGLQTMPTSGSTLNWRIYYEYKTGV